MIYVLSRREPIVIAAVPGIVTGHRYPAGWWSYVVLPKESHK